MNKYLEKIAKEYHTKTEEKSSVGSKIGLGLGGWVGSDIAGGVATLNANKFARTSFHPSKQVYSDDLIDKVYQTASKRHNVTTDINEAKFTSPVKRAEIEKVMSSSGPSFLHSGALPSHIHPDSKSYIHGFGHNSPAHNKDILLHELGHATDYGTYTKAKTLSDRIARTPIWTLAGGGLLTNEKTRDYAWAAPVVGGVGALRGEIAANRNAASLIREHGGDASKFKSFTRKNMLSYTAGPAAAAATLWAINKLRRKGEEVNPEEHLAQRG